MTIPGAFRRTVLLPLTMAALMLPALTTWAQSYPNKPVNVIVGFGAGSGTDILARIICEELRLSLGQPFVVMNKGGATAAIAAEFVAKAPADGYTLFITSNSSHSVNPHIYKSLRYDPLKDFTPVGRIADFPFVLVSNPDVPVKSPQELVAYIRSHPGKTSYAYGNTPGQVAGAAMAKLLKLETTAVPYKSSPPAMADVASGQEQFMVVDLASSQAFVKAGRLRALAVTTSTRSALVPELPTMAESLGLVGYDLRAWTGMFGPASMPADVTARLSTELQKILARPEIKARLLAGNMEPTPAGAAEFTTFLSDQYRIWGAKIKEAGIEME